MVCFIQVCVCKGIRGGGPTVVLCCELVSAVLLTSVWLSRFGSCLWVAVAARTIMRVRWSIGRGGQVSPASSVG